MAHRYCEHCGNPQGRITIENLQEFNWSGAKIECAHCGKDRSDDTPSERILILLDEVLALKEKVGS